MSSEPRSSADDWEAHWKHYAASAAGNPAQRMRHEIIARLLCQNTGNAPARVFDLGSGQGDLLRKLGTLLPDAHLLGAELSERGVAISRSKVPEAIFIVADIMTPPSSLNNYIGWATHAICSEVLEHVDDPVSFLKRTRSYLAQQASLIVTVPGGPMSAFDRHIGHRQHFDRQTIGRILEQAGYSVERVYLSGFPFFNLYRLLVVARGEQLARDVEAGSSDLSAALASLMMKVFRLLFRANLIDSPFGWQVVAVARKTSS